ncbi:MAG TPA: hypothetical protein VJH37_02975 [Candidatus Nanoarchaeia archaeon]|nr:hypothetical protein [Candidatus Nanoarchaeia archaeon]
MKKLWFKAKSYGWGWYPVTWEGWLVTVLFVLLILFWEMLVMKHNMDIMYFLIGVLLLTGAIIAICYKTGEKPEWRWGKKKKIK